MQRTIIYPYKMNSDSAQLLKQAVGGLCVYPDGKYQPKEGDVIINWGCSKEPIWAEKAKVLGLPVLNHWQGIAKSVSKIRSLYHFEKNGVPHPPWTLLEEEARDWVVEEGRTVFARHRIKGHLGEGITVIQKAEDFVPCRLYTTFVPGMREFRIHVFKKLVISIQEKRKKNGVEANPFIRAEANGYVFCLKDVPCTPNMEEAAIKAVSALGLDFGGVDLLWEPDMDMVWVLEVNSAPGIVSNYGLEQYATQIKHLSTMG